ncbi:MAG TPA: protein YgfX [Usitatibacter sp.]|nr:protein YgfX [Usitatibacter sp.]
MEVKYSDANVTLTVAPSRRLAACIGLAAAVTVLLLATTPGPVIARALAAGWCIAMAIHAARRVAVTRRVRITGGVSVMVEEGGRAREGRIVAGSFVAPWLTIIHWRPEGAWFTRTVLIVPGMVEPGRFRALRVVLRWA